MLVAENLLTSERYFPYQEENEEIIIKNKDNLICPFCKEKVNFVNGQIKIAHFRHHIKSECSTEPETIEHLNMKRFFIDKMNLTKSNVEVNLGFAKPDIYLPEKRIAIEVQHSSISLDNFLLRTKKYTDNNIAVLWIFDSCLLRENVSALLRKAHELYFGRIYLFNNDSIIPIHLNPIKKYVEEKEIPEYIDNYEEYVNNGRQPYWKTVGGYEKILKTKKEVIIGDEINIFSDLLISRNTWKGNNYLIAKFIDVRFWK